LIRTNQKLTLIKNILEKSLNQKAHRKMFNIVTKTWNPISGCLYNCNYCWAKNLAETKLKKSKRYSKGFKPIFNESELKVNFKSADLVFVSDMGDMFADVIATDWIKKVLNHIRKFPEADFLLMTKNPKRYLEVQHFIPDNAILGVTIETTNDEIIKEDKISKAPLPSLRYEAMKNLDWNRKMVSIEPILDFDLDLFVKWIQEINPFLVYVGYDNYCHELREPLLKKTTELIDRVSINALVIRKTIRPAWFESKELNKGKKNEYKT